MSEDAKYLVHWKSRKESGTTPAIKAEALWFQGMSLRIKERNMSKSKCETPQLPKLTHLQFLVLDILGSNETRGKELRDELARRGVRKSGPAFYQMMARLEDSKMVEGSYTQETVDGQIIKERKYKLLATGRTAWMTCRNFYGACLSKPRFAYG